MTRSTHLRRSVGALTLAALCAAAAGCGPDAPAVAPRPQAEPPAVPVAFATAATARATRYVRGTGTFFADETVSVGAKVEGRVVAVGPDAGDRVPADAELARVDDVDYVLVRDQRARAFQESLARLALDALPEGEPDFSRLPSVERLRLEAANARSRFERVKELFDRTPPLVSEQDFADAKTAREVAESAERGALLAARAELAQARTRKSELATAEQRVRDAAHRAPKSDSPWLAAERLVAVGDYVKVGDPLYRLVDVDPLKLRVRVPERRAAGVVPGRAASATLAGAAPLRGVVTRVRPEIDPRTRTVDIEIEIPNADLRLLPGAFGVAEIDVGEDDGLVVVPERAIASFAGVRKVYVPVDGRAVERAVTVGRLLPEGREIVAGLKAGERYVAEPPPALVGGARLVDAASRPASRPSDGAAK